MRRYAKSNHQHWRRGGTGSHQCYLKYAIGFVPGQENEGLAANGEGSRAGCPATTTPVGKRARTCLWGSPAAFTFAWYRTTITIPETVNGRPTNGMRVQFETCVDDYGEIWIDGECNRRPGYRSGIQRCSTGPGFQRRHPRRSTHDRHIGGQRPAGRAVWDRVRPLCQPRLRVDRVLRPGDPGCPTGWWTYRFADAGRVDSSPTESPGPTVCHLARSSPEAAYLPSWSSHLGDGAGTTWTRAGAGRRLQPWGPCRWRTHRREPMGTTVRTGFSTGWGLGDSILPFSGVQLAKPIPNCSRQLLAGLPPMDVGITGIMPPEVRGWQLRESCRPQNRTSGEAATWFSHLSLPALSAGDSG